MGSGHYIEVSVSPAGASDFQPASQNRASPSSEERFRFKITGSKIHLAEIQVRSPVASRVELIDLAPREGPGGGVTEFHLALGVCLLALGTAGLSWPIIGKRWQAPTGSGA